MSAHLQNPGMQAGASRDLLCLSWLHSPFSASGLKAQTFATRFCLSPWMARDVAWLCFGEGCND